MDFVEIGKGGVNLIGLAQHRDKWRALVNVVIDLRVLSNTGKLSSGATQLVGFRVVVSSI
jgi:D-Tyr-tRNAtyr deacylase